MAGTSDLLLKRFRLQRLAIEFNDAWLGSDKRAAEEGYESDADFDLWRSQTKPDSCMVMLRVDCRAPAEAAETRFLHAGITLWGVFATEPSLGETVKHQLSEYNTVAILHGIARGVIVSATGSCPGGPFLLPVINYQEIVERKQQTSTEKSETDECQEPVEGLGDE